MYRFELHNFNKYGNRLDFIVTTSYNLAKKYFSQWFKGKYTIYCIEDGQKMNVNLKGGNI